MVGDLLEMEHFTPSRVILEYINGLAEGYGTLSDEMSFRVAIHAGVHMINWCSRHAPPEGELFTKVTQLMEKATAFVVAGWKQDRLWFERSVLASLFPSS